MAGGLLVGLMISCKFGPGVQRGRRSAGWRWRGFSYPFVLNLHPMISLLAKLQSEHLRVDRLV